MIQSTEMTDPSSSVADLIDESRRGNADARDKLIYRYRPWLLMLVRMQGYDGLQHKFDASDVVQQAMLEAVRDLPQFQGSTEAEFAAWLRQILAHTLGHEVRRFRSTDKRDVSREVSIDQSLEQSSMRLRQMLTDDASSPSHQAARAEQEVFLAEVMERLPDDYRQIIVLRNLAGVSHAEAARRMNRDEGAVRMLWVRALARLKKELQS